MYELLPAGLEKHKRSCNDKSENKNVRLEKTVKGDWTRRLEEKAVVFGLLFM